MAAPKMNMLEKLANISGVIYRYHAAQWPRREGILKKVLKQELAPPTMKEWPQVKKDFSKLQQTIESEAYRQLTIREALTYGAVFVEVVCWFFVGEMIGRGNICGYLVKANYIDPVAAKKMKKYAYDDTSEILH